MPNRALRWLPAALAPVVVAGVVSVPLVAAAAPPALPAKTPAQVLQLAAKGADLEGFSGTVEQTSALGLPELPATGAGTDSATASGLDLITGDHRARVWAADGGRSRVAVLDSTAERDVVRNGRSVWLWDSKKNSATHVVASGTAATPSAAALPNPAVAAKEVLAKVDGSTRVTVDTAQRVAGRDAYTLVLTPRTSATTVRDVRIAVDAASGLPLQVSVTARGASSPAFQTGFTTVSTAAPADSVFDFTPPKDAEVTTKRVSVPAHPHTGTHGAKPATTGSGWASIVEIPASSVPADLASNPTVQRLTTTTAAGRVLHTALVNVLLTDDGRAFAGAVPVSALEAAAG